LAELLDVTDESFDSEVAESQTPVLLDFWGDHCAACRQISPILKELADEYADRVKILKIHAAENMSTSARFNIRTMPTVLGFAGGQVVGQIQGGRPRAEFVELIEKLLAA
jgi:thioredoxin 1